MGNKYYSLHAYEDKDSHKVVFFFNKSYRALFSVVSAGFSRRKGLVLHFAPREAGWKETRRKAVRSFTAFHRHKPEGCEGNPHNNTKCWTFGFHVRTHLRGLRAQGGEPTHRVLEGLAGCLCPRFAAKQAKEQVIGEGSRTKGCPLERKGATKGVVLKRMALWGRALQYATGACRLHFGFRHSARNAHLAALSSELGVV
ncbi:hypothetical protein DQ04_13551030 [Trypanosoma grayi]|uniref:hypothetical protein n=1 Tax=Trypanosoma grayi TaxID=71804 RepID=UPI0004F415D0|nr:hypothetical protein DQ04_13551030 [Trypanosoma grayi]KEG06516.1 hypothetical protein DQ04_13551030 [Trypanosoma grayi]